MDTYRTQVMFHRPNGETGTLWVTTKTEDENEIIKTARSLWSWQHGERAFRFKIIARGNLTEVQGK